jgi:hypothetical protein
VLELEEVIAALLRLIGIAELVVRLKGLLEELEGGRELAPADELEDCGFDIDDMQDLDRGAPYIWNRR